MSKGNVPILLLLGGDKLRQALQEGQPQGLVSQFQTNVFPTVAPGRDQEESAPVAQTGTVQQHLQLPQGDLLQYMRSDDLAKFQLSFRLTEAPSFPVRALINSIMNDEAPDPKEKRKRAPPKTEPAKKAKTEPKKTETKPAPKRAKKKKTPEAVPQELPAFHPAMTTDKAKTQHTVALPPPTFSEAKREEEKEEEERPIISLHVPLLNPIDPRPGQAEVVINVLKLAEEKYGWTRIHPNAKSAIELMDEMLDEDDDAMDEDDIEEIEVDKKGDEKQEKKEEKQEKKEEKKEEKPEEAKDETEKESKKKTKKKEDLTEEQKVKQQEARMNRRVGKYDFEDPFIDDAELQWEEEITTTKDGFFVYWGPLVEDKTASKKATKKR